ncbi:MAG: DUF1501 domain-containing protein [Planctomycetes bacterium]|nr:DUF1501 domain-containing protein [Planctomycetota bacterium]
MSLRFFFDESPSRSELTRREWLRIGGLGLYGAAGLQAKSRRANSSDSISSQHHSPGFGQAKSVIVLYASGGQSQLETWDPKPEAPEVVRGEFGSIATPIAGVRVCEHMPKLAALADRYTIVRSVSHDDLDHGSATYLTMTGQFHSRKSSNPPPTPDDAPVIGAILDRVRPAQKFPYSAIHLNGPILVPELPSPGQYSAILGRRHEPLTVGDVTESALVLDGLQPQTDLSSIRQSSRTTLLDAIDHARGQFEADRQSAAVDEYYRQALRLLSSPKSRDAFDLSLEPTSLRDRYGRFRSGQACLLARRLVEADVPLITVFLSQSGRGQDKLPGLTDAYGWDTHNDIFEAMHDHLLPRFDQCFAALLEDLEERGLLDSTLVVCMGEFGRAPKVALERTFAGTSPGRKHWAAVYSIVMAGAGVGRGHIVGASDRHASYPESGLVTPGDIMATIFSALGVDPSGHYTDPSGRPIPIATGRPIGDLYA